MKIAFKSVWKKIKKLRFKLIKRLVLKHRMLLSSAKFFSDVIFIVIVIILLIFTPITLPILAIAFLIYSSWLQNRLRKIMNKKWTNRQNKHLYLKKIAPYNWKFYLPIHLPEANYVQFGGARDKKRGIKYIFVMDGQKIIVPESKYGKARQYYLTDINFHPHFDSTHHEVPSVALLTLVQVGNFKNSFKIIINKTTSYYVHILEVYFQLTSIQKKHLHL